MGAHLDLFKNSCLVGEILLQTSRKMIKVRHVAGDGHSNFLTWHFLEIEEVQKISK